MSKLPDKCVCGSEYVVYWVERYSQFSSRMPREYYDPAKHPQASCYRCNRSVREQAAQAGKDGAK